MICMGIDAGATGAAAVVQGGKLTVLAIERMPTLRKIVGGRRARVVIDESALAKWIRDNTGDAAVFEASIVKPGQSVVSVKTTCENVAFIRGVLTALGVPFVACRPREWQKWAYSGIDGSGKDRSLLAARRLFPQVDIARAEHGIADALLMAAWGAAGRP